MESKFEIDSKEEGKRSLGADLQADGGGSVSRINEHIQESNEKKRTRAVEGLDYVRCFRRQGKKVHFTVCVKRCDFADDGCEDFDTLSKRVKAAMQVLAAKTAVQLEMDVGKKDEK